MAKPTDRSPSPRADREAERIFTAIFRRLPSAVVADRFLTVSEKLDEAASPSERQLYQRALARVTDLEALELAARLNGRLTLLSTKFRVMVHIAETVPENQHFFVSRNTSLRAALWAIGFGSVRSAFKFVKGLILLRSLGDA